MTQNKSDELVKAEISAKLPHFAEINGCIINVKEVLYIQPVDEAGKECEVFFKTGHSLNISLVRWRTKRGGGELETRMSLNEIKRELGM